MRELNMYMTFKIYLFHINCQITSRYSHVCLSTLCYLFSKILVFLTRTFSLALTHALVGCIPPTQAVSLFMIPCFAGESCQP